MNTPPTRFTKILTKAGIPTSRFAEWMEDVSNSTGIDGSTGATGSTGPAGPTGPAGSLPDPESLNFTYNGDGTVLNILGNTTDIDFTYSSGLVATIYDQTFLKTFAYNGSNQLTSITVT